MCQTAFTLFPSTSKDLDLTQLLNAYTPPFLRLEPNNRRPIGGEEANNWRRRCNAARPVSCPSMAIRV